MTQGLAGLADSVSDDWRAEGEESNVAREVIDIGLMVCGALSKWRAVRKG